MTRKKRLKAKEYIDGILNHQKVIFSQAVTLIESNLPSDKELALEILEKILPFTGKSTRIGITGVPGVGKSTFIEAFGKHITSQSKKLAVLAVDPTSQRSKGSIMGDKTRMEHLSVDPLAFIRPSPSQSSLGGVARHTREIMLLCEAAGFDVIIVETVGVGQSETLVHGMVDFFLLLMLAGAGDELQGIKKGIMEMADGIAITKADGDNIRASEHAKAEFINALHLFPPSLTGWYPDVLTCSALKGDGIAEIWSVIAKHQDFMQKKGFFEQKRQEQNLNWMHETIREYLENSFYQNEKVNQQLDFISNQVKNGKIQAIKGALTLLDVYKQSK